ncbi:MAG: ABC transporter permease [Chloroflexota bacterium]
MTAASPPTATVRPGPISSIRAALGRDAWVAGLAVLVVLLLVFTRSINPNYGASGIQSLAVNVLPLAFAALAQTTVVIAGGIDLSIASMMALTNMVAATLMLGRTDDIGVAVVVGVLVLGVVIGAVNGFLIVWTRVADIIVTLAMSFVWAGFALWIAQAPVRSPHEWLSGLVNGPVLTEFLPKAFVVLAVAVTVIWIPLRLSRLGLAIYAVGSNPLAAFRSGVSVGRTKVLAYALAGLFAAIGGLALSAITGQGNPLPGGFTLASVAAVVLGGVSLAGGRGGAVGPILAVMVLSLIQTDMTFLGLNSNLATVTQGVILIAVVVLGSLTQRRRASA